MDFIIFAAYQNHRFTGEIEQEIIPDIRNLAVVSGIHPGIEENALKIALVNIRIAIKGSRQPMTWLALGNQFANFLIDHFEYLLCFFRYAARSAPRQ